MKIYIGYLEEFYDNCDTDVEEKLAKAKIEVLKEKSKKDYRFVVDNDENYIYMLGDISIELGFTKVEEFSLFIQCYNESDWIDMDSLKIEKEDCINLLLDKIENNEEKIVKKLNDIFSKSEVSYKFIYELINSQIKYVVLDKIQSLQKSLIEEDFSDVKWK